MRGGGKGEGCGVSANEYSCSWMILREKYSCQRKRRLSLFKRETFGRFCQFQMEQALQPLRLIRKHIKGINDRSPELFAVVLLGSIPSFSPRQLKLATGAPPPQNSLSLIQGITHTDVVVYYISPNAGGRGGEGSCGISANEYSCAHGAQISFGDLTPYLSYALIYAKT